jgi:hypothetical protein
MPDDWEELYCLDPDNASDGPGDADKDGYTNIEEYLNGTEPATASICLLFELQIYLPTKLFPQAGGSAYIR